MLQIISNSNETSTGPELVQNGDFSELGADVVQNGAFNELGSDVITNGSFDVLGAELNIADGSSPEPNHFKFDGYGTNVIAYDGSGVTTITYVDSATGGYQYLLTTYNLSPSDLVVGKSYEISITTKINSGSYDIDIYNGTSFSTIASGLSNTGFVTTTHSFLKGSGWSYIRCVNIGTGQVVSINNISVKELGEDWTNGLGWSYGDSKAISTQALGSQLVLNPDFTDTGGELITNGDFATDTDWSKGSGWTISGGVANSDGTNSTLSQTAMTAEKSVKITVTVTGSPSLLVFGLSSFYGTTAERTLSNGTNTYYLTTKSTTFSITNAGADACTIDNVSVEELGGDWTVVAADATHYVEFISTGSRFVSPTATPLIELKQASWQLISGTTYKLSVDMTLVSGGVKVQTNGIDETFDATTSGTNNTRYITPTFNTNLSFYRQSTPVDITFHSVSVEEISTSYLTQSTSLSAKTWKLIYTVSDFLAGSVSATDYGVVTTADSTVTEYAQIGVASDFRMVNIDGYFEGSVSGISAQLVDPNARWVLQDGWTINGSGVNCNIVTSKYIKQSAIFDITKMYKCFIDVTSLTGNLQFNSGGTILKAISTAGQYTFYASPDNTDLFIYGLNTTVCTITNISVEQLDPNDYWNLNAPPWTLEEGKAVSDGTQNQTINQAGVTTLGKTYVAKYDILSYTSGSGYQQRIGNGSTYSDAETSIATHSTTQIATGNDYIYISSGDTIGSITNVSTKLLGSYSDQSMYVTAADVQTIAQADVYYLVELTSMGSKNSLYFLPSSVVANNGRYTKLNFTVVSKDATPTPASGIISFYDSVGGVDTYPMGFYEFKIYEQTSSTNLDPLLATGLLEKGFAFVRDFSGNMQELTDGYKEYNPTLTQYVYSK